MGLKGSALPPCINGYEYHDFGGSFDLCMRCLKGWHELFIEHENNLYAPKDRRKSVLKLQRRPFNKEVEDVSETD